MCTNPTWKQRITPYIHLAVYHVPAMIKRHTGIKMFSGQGLEKNNSESKAYLRSSNKHNPTQVILQTKYRQRYVSLSFNDYFSKICKTFQQRVNLLCYMGKHLSASTIMLLYKSYVRPVVEYSITVWFCRLTAKQLSVLDVSSS